MHWLNSDRQQQEQQGHRQNQQEHHVNSGFIHDLLLLITTTTATTTTVLFPLAVRLTPVLGEQPTTQLQIVPALALPDSRTVQGCTLLLWLLLLFSQWDILVVEWLVDGDDGGGPGAVELQGSVDSLSELWFLLGCLCVVVLQAEDESLLIFPKTPGVPDSDASLDG